MNLVHQTWKSSYLPQNTQVIAIPWTPLIFPSCSCPSSGCTTLLSQILFDLFHKWYPLLLGSSFIFCIYFGLSPLLTLQSMLKGSKLALTNVYPGVCPSSYCKLIKLGSSTSISSAIVQCISHFSDYSSYVICISFTCQSLMWTIQLYSWLVDSQPLNKHS